MRLRGTQKRIEALERALPPRTELNGAGNETVQAALLLLSIEDLQSLENAAEIPLTVADERDACKSHGATSFRQDAYPSSISWVCMRLAQRVSKLEATEGSVTNGKLTIAMIDRIVNRAISESELMRWLPAIEPILLASSREETRLGS